MTHLEEVVRDLERHSAEEGWDAPPRLYALVESAELRRQEPGLAEQLGLSAASDTIAALEQPQLPGSASLEEALATIIWPEAVTGCALIVERVILPPEAEEQIPDDEGEVPVWLAGHPLREDVRMVVGVLRDGSRYSALRLRTRDSADQVLSGADLVPGLADALAATLEPETED